MNVATTPRPKAHGWIAGAALAWNLIGLLVFVLQVLMTPAQVAAMPPLERAVYDATPTWLHVAFGVAVGAGVVGSMGLLLRQRWAASALALSLAALLVQVAGAYLATPAWQAYGMAGAVMPVLLVTIGALLLRYARRTTS